KAPLKPSAPGARPHPAGERERAKFLGPGVKKRASGEGKRKEKKSEYRHPAGPRMHEPRCLVKKARGC
ncbi:MAG: hypothetical protein MK133_08120, partial [Planctomycetes bacterium]|nr:hypothetical protein [Planctomycetota bacterium]